MRYRSDEKYTSEVLVALLMCISLSVIITNAFGYLNENKWSAAFVMLPVLALVIWLRKAFDNGVKYSRVVLFAVCALLGVAFIGHEIGIFYSSADAAGHFDMAQTFSINGVPLYKKQSLNTGYYGYPTLYYMFTGYFMSVAETAVDKVWIFNSVNILLYFGVSFVIFQTCNQISSKRLLAYAIGLLLVLGFPLDLLLNGYMSQLVGVLYIATIIFAAISQKHNSPLFSEKHQTLMYTLLVSGVYYSYQLYVPLAIGIVAVTLWPRISNIFKISILVFLLGIPVLSLYLSDASTIKADGGISKDIYSSFIPFLAGFALFYDCSDKLSRFLRGLLALALLNVLLMYALVSFELASPYYFFKFYVLLSLAFGFSALYVYDRSDWKAIRNWIVLTLSIGCGATYLFFHKDFYSDVLKCQNNPIYRYNLFNLENGFRMPVDVVRQIGEAVSNEDKHLAYCVVGTDARQMIWFQVLSGVYYRGAQVEKYPWSEGQAWRDLETDPRCCEQYDRVINLKK